MFDIKAAYLGPQISRDGTPFFFFRVGLSGTDTTFNFNVLGQTSNNNGPFRYLAMRKLSSSLFVFVQGFAFGSCSHCILLRRCQQPTHLLWKVLILGAVLGFTKGRYFGSLPQRSLKQ